LGLVVLVLVGFILVELVWFAVCNRWKHVGIILVLATRVRLVSLSLFSPKGETYELVALGYRK
jgi:hypothetical protein